MTLKKVLTQLNFFFLFWTLSCIQCFVGVHLPRSEHVASQSNAALQNNYFNSKFSFSPYVQNLKKQFRHPSSLPDKPLSFVYQATSSCEATLAQLNSNAALNKTSILQAFNLIFSFFDKNISIQDDKSLTYAFTVVYNYFKSPKIVSISSSVVLHMLSSCRMGPSQRTLPMQLIAHGLSQVLEHPLCLQLMSQPSLATLQDGDDNTIIHLSVLPGSLFILTYVINKLNLLHSEDYMKLFLAQNKQGFTPLNLAVLNHYSTIAESLRAHHTVYSALAKNASTTFKNDNFLLGERIKSVGYPESQSCFKTLESLSKFQAVWNAPVAAAIRVIVASLLQPPDNKDLLDKQISQALLLISQYSSTSLSLKSFHIVQSFQTCFLDQNMNTFLTLFVRYGLVQSLKRNIEILLPQSHSMRKIRDKNKNNILHFAIDSKSAEILLWVLSKIHSGHFNSKNSSGKSSDVSVLALYYQQNNNGFTPLSYANQHGTIEMINILQAHYAVYYQDSRFDLQQYCPSFSEDTTSCCHTLLNMKNSLDLYNSPFVIAYRTIGFSFLEHNSLNFLDLDKFVFKALTVITDHLTKSMEGVLSDPSILQLSDCFWSSRKENILMMIIRFGLIETLNMPHFQFFLRSSHNLSSLIDNEGHNLLHLAVLSKNADVVLQVIHLLDSEFIPILDLMTQKDSRGYSPRELAAFQRSILIYEILTAHYTTSLLQNT
ncbi:uncharacterized protein LOC128884305 [Hylaeus volcanicus]|uniref:uncharacterized protein LOC128884305 n=1 Tax=Hylaeus volcanicus TaxID=313075 RepID=UPI0023B86889|nr:uncharacterized protein LOC128884305 [Hylaeus volcanicus]